MKQPKRRFVPLAQLDLDMFVSPDIKRPWDPDDDSDDDDDDIIYPNLVGYAS